MKTGSGIFLIIFLLCLFPVKMLGQEDKMIERINLAIIASDYKLALHLCDSAIKNQHISAELFYKQSIAYRSVYHYKKAYKSIGDALDLNPDNINIRIEFGKVCYALDMLNSADSVFSEIFKFDTTNYISGIYLTRIYIKKKEFDKAFSVFKTLSEMDSLNNYLFRQMGICKIKDKKSKKAIPCFQRAIEIDSTDIKSYEYLSMIYQALGEYDRALSFLNKAIQIEPLNPGLYFEIGELHYSRNHHYKAIPAYLKSIKLGNDSPWLYRNIGTSYYRIMDFKKAKKYLLIAIREFKDPEIYHRLGKIYLELNQPDSSSIYLEKSLDILLPEPITLCSLYSDLAQSFIKKYEYEEAILRYEKIFKIEFRRSARYYYQNQANIGIARIYEQNLNDKKKAIEYYMKIINNKSKYKNPNQIEYAEYKIKKLKEELFFEGQY